ncbi:MAG: cation:dicarboxylase symporter family transporter [Rhodothermales bacterium]|nr:cation:dicarboxylase symporter family transporter [Rhodothermales bacterium]
MRLPKRYQFLTIGSLLGLALGFGLGLFDHGAQTPTFGAVMAPLVKVEHLWIDILRIIVYPLIVSYMVIAVAAAAKTRVSGKVGGVAIVTHIALLIVTAAFTVTIGPTVLRLFPVSPESIEAFQRSAAAESAAAGMQAGPTAEALDTSGMGLFERIYTTLFSLDIVVVLIVTVVFALILARVAARYRDPILEFFRMVSRLSLLAVDGLLLFMPLVIVVVTYNVTASIGGRFAGTIVYWLVLICSMLIVATLGVYLAVAAVGGVRMKDFARAMLPVQALAIASRSSLICLPKLLDAGAKTLKLPEHVNGIVLPLSVSTFKLNRMVSTPLNLFFLVHLYGINLDWAIAASLVFTAMILSFATPGIPSGGKFTTLPIYLAAGVPVEGVVLLKAVDAIPDLFKTIINVTEDLGVATITARFVPGADAAVVTAAEPVRVTAR